MTNHFGLAVPDQNYYPDMTQNFWNRYSTTQLVVIALAIGAAALVGIVMAAAWLVGPTYSDYEQIYLNGVSDNPGVAYLTEDQRLAQGYEICDDLRSGSTAMTVVAQMMTRNDQSWDDAAAQMGSAIGALCGDQRYKLG